MFFVYMSPFPRLAFPINGSHEIVVSFFLYLAAVCVFDSNGDLIISFISPTLCFFPLLEHTTCYSVFFSSFIFIPTLLPLFYHDAIHLLSEQQKQHERTNEKKYSNMRAVSFADRCCYK